MADIDVSVGTPGAQESEREVSRLRTQLERLQAQNRQQAASERQAAGARKQGASALRDVRQEAARTEQEIEDYARALGRAAAAEKRLGGNARFRRRGGGGGGGGFRQQADRADDFFGTLGTNLSVFSTEAADASNIVSDLAMAGGKFGAGMIALTGGLAAAAAATGIYMNQMMRLGQQAREEYQMRTSLAKRMQDAERARMQTLEQAALSEGQRFQQIFLQGGQQAEQVARVLANEIGAAATDAVGAALASGRDPSSLLDVDFARLRQAGISGDQIVAGIAAGDQTAEQIASRAIGRRVTAEQLEAARGRLGGAPASAAQTQALEYGATIDAMEAEGRLVGASGLDRVTELRDPGSGVMREFTREMTENIGALRAEAAARGAVVETLMDMGAVIGLSEGAAGTRANRMQAQSQRSMSAVTER